ncbi:MAG: response regulator transcription factor [Actinomycetota bacterium]|nr:response regulator transcription factor [Actinomycetota bacterium]
MRIALHEGQPALNRLVHDVLGRAHDLTSLSVPDPGQPAANTFDLVVVVWPGRALGRAGAANRLHGVAAERVLAVVPHDLTADRLGAVDVGVDYVAHPFHPLELVRRVELLGGSARRTRTALRVGDTLVDEGSRQVLRGRHPIELTRKEFDLLAYLVRNQGLVQDRTTLLDSVWGSTSYNPNVIEVTISGLRQKLEQRGPRIIHTVRGVGYVCREDHTAEESMQTLMEHREALLAERRRLMEQRQGLVERARAARSTRSRSADDRPGAGSDVREVDS